MQTRTLKVIEYRGKNVYFRNFGSIFEYLAVIDGQLYGSHIVMKKPLWLRLTGRDYTEKHLSDACKYLEKLAEATVDYVLAPTAT